MTLEKQLQPSQHYLQFRSLGLICYVALHETLYPQGKGCPEKEHGTASDTQWSCPGISPTARWHKQSWALTLCQPFRNIYNDDAAVCNTVILTGSPCLRILHLRDSSKSVPGSNIYRGCHYVLQSGHTADERKKKKKKTKCFCRAHQCRKLKPYIGDPYIARSIPYELRLKGCKLLCFISWGHKDNRGGSTHVPQRV